MTMTVNTAVPAAVRRKTAAATIIGNTIEFYDFTVYGTLTALVFGRIFFGDIDVTTATLLAFGTFAAGFLSRPLGGIIFGHFGDRFGRKPVLVASLLTMGGATTLMGLLPTYDAVGWLAPLLLVLLRFIQGFGIGGEWGGAVTLMLETAPENKRGFFGSLVQTGSGMGIMLATAIVTLLVAVLSPEQMLAWGWRIPLLFSLVLVIVGLVVRSKIEESPEFKNMKQTETVARVPVLETLTKHWRVVLLAIGMYIGIGAFGFTQGVFFVNFLVNNVGLPQATATTANLIAAFTYFLATIIGGILSDRVGRTRAYIFGGLLLIPAPFLMFWGGSIGDVAIIFVVMAIVGLCSGIGYGAQAALFFDLFPARVRYTGISLGFQIAAVIGGGITPILATALTASTGSTVPISLYLVALAVLLIVCTLIAPSVVRKEANR